MVKSVARDQESSSPSSSSERINHAFNSSSSPKYKGVRKRTWGKYVTEIRLPNSRERIWLGSYDSAEKAARAFDAALFCLRGSSAKFNFPNNPPEIVNGRSMTSSEIQVAAARFANSQAAPSIIKGSGRVDNNSDNSSTSVSSLSEPELRADSPCPSVSDGVVVRGTENEMSEIPLDTDFLNMFSVMGTENNVPDFGIFPGFDDFFGSPSLTNIDYGEENEEGGFSSSQVSFLWNF